MTQSTEECDVSIKWKLSKEVVCVALSLCVALLHSGCVEHLRRALWPCPSTKMEPRATAKHVNKHDTVLQPQVRDIGDHYNLHQQAQINKTETGDWMLNYIFIYCVFINV